MAWCVGARAATRTHAHAFRVVPAARRVAGRAAVPCRYGARPGPRAARRPRPRRHCRLTRTRARARTRTRAAALVPVVRRATRREHGSLRACRLPRIFILILAHRYCLVCVRSLRCGGIHRRLSKVFH